MMFKPDKINWEFAGPKLNSLGGFGEPTAAMSVAGYQIVYQT